MATTIFQEAGTSATGGFEFWTATNGTVSSETTIVRNGPRSIKVDSTTGVGSDYVVRKNSVMADAGRRFSFWFRFGTLPVVNNAAIVAILQSNDSTIVFDIKLTTAGKLRLAWGGGTLDSSQTLVTDTWYRISCGYVITSTTVNEFRVYLNGNLEITKSNGTITAITSSVIRVGWCYSADIGTNRFGYFSDIYIDNGTDLADPGNIGVTAKLPAANNTNSFDTSVGANPGNRWTNVNERPLSATNGWRHAAISDVQENYTLQAANVGDYDIGSFPLIARTAWMWAKQDTAAGGTPGIVDDGSVTGVTLTTSAALYTLITDSATYPSNAAGIGMRSANHANDVYLFECGTILSYLEGYPERRRTSLCQHVNNCGFGAEGVQVS